jgi:hypothetical protein
MATLTGFKASDTFAYGGLVSGLAAGVGWQAAASVRSSGGVVLCALATTLVQASDYVTSGNWVLTLYAASAQTSQWTSGGYGQTLNCDIKFSAAGGADPVAHSETFQIAVLGAIT